MYQRTFIALGAIVLFALVCVGWTIWLGQSKGDEFAEGTLSLCYGHSYRDADVDVGLSHKLLYNAQQFHQVQTSHPP